MNLFYRRTGKGTPIVVLHGLYGSSDNWMQIARMLAQHFQVITVDLRNHGASPHDNEHSYETMVNDVAGLFYKLKIEKANILGHSMGGKVAMAFAADYPEKIISLTVVDIAPKNYLESSTSAIQYDFHKRLLQSLSEIDLSQYHSRKEIDEQLKKNGILQQQFRQFILKNLHRTGENFEWKINVPVLKASLDHIIRGVNAEEYANRIPITGYPVLFIKGSLSDYIQPADEALIKKMYPEAKIETIEGATHLLHAEKPKEFVNILCRHLIK